MGRTIEVAATGEASAEPDIATVRAMIREVADEPAVVRDELRPRAEEVRDALLEAGIDEDDLTSDGPRIRRRVDEGQMRQDGVEPRSEEDIERYEYYIGEYEFEITVADTDDVGETIDIAIDAGVDGIGRIRYTLAEETKDELRDDALNAALGHAQDEAAIIADEADTNLGDPIEVDTSTRGPGIPYARATMDDVADADVARMETELHPDDVTVTANVEVIFAME